MTDAIRFNQPVLDPWQRTLFLFVQKHHRPATSAEWKMMRYWFDMEQLRKEEPVMSLAADGETLNSVIECEISRTQTWNFKSEDGNYRVNITVRGRGDADRVVYLKMTDGEGQPVRDGKIYFPGLDSEIDADAHGRAKIAYGDFQKYLREVMCFMGGDGAIYKLDLE